MIASAVITVIAFTTIVVVTLVMANQYKGSKVEMDTRLRNVVDQVNTAQQYSYEFDKRQQQQLTGLERDVDEIRQDYLKKVDAEQKLTTKQLTATNIDTSGQVKLHSSGWNSGAMQFNSDISGASKSVDYTISRGGKPENMNQLVIKTPTEDGSGVTFMSADGRPQMQIDSKSSQVNVPTNLKANSLQLGDKWKISGVGDAQGNDAWLRFFSKDGKDYYGGIAAANIWTRDNAYLNGNTNITGMGNVTGNLYIRGGSSEHNQGGWQTHFPWAGDNKNYIRGDTEIRGNTNNIGDLSVGRNMNVASTLNVQGATNLNKPVKLNHKVNDAWANEAPISAYTDAGKVGASFGSQYWSHLPWADGNTYIRPGLENRSIMIGDVGAAAVNIGRGNTATNINGTLSLNNGDWNWLKINRNAGDQMYFGADGTNKGIWNDGARDFSIYTSGNKRFSINKDGQTTYTGDTYAPSIGRTAGEKDWFRVNVANSKNANNSGTAVYNGMAVNEGGGLAVGNWWKVPEGQANIRDALKVRHNLSGDWYDKAAITAWTPNNQFVGPSFGGPTYWSHFPWYDGDTYIRPGREQGRVLIGDAGASQVQLGSATSEQKLGANSLIPAADGNTYIRPGGEGKNVYVGDTLAKDIHIGRSDNSGSVMLKPTNAYVRRYIDAWDKYNNTKTIFTGWNSDKTVLGNNATAAQAYVDKLPTNTVASANDMYVYGKATATNSLCVNNTCLNESDLIKVKSWL